jgi:hypothetical protein
MACWSVGRGPGDGGIYLMFRWLGQLRPKQLFSLFGTICPEKKCLATLRSVGIDKKFILDYSKFDF